MIPTTPDVARWCAEAERLGVAVPDDLTAATRGLGALTAAMRALNDDGLTARRNDAVADLVTAAMTGTDPDLTATLAVARDAATLDHQRKTLSLAIEAASNKLAWLFRDSTDRLIAAHLRPRFAELIAAARDNHGRHPVDPNQGAEFAGVLTDLSAVVRLRDRLWGRLPREQRDAASTFFRYVRDADRHEDPRRIGGNVIPSRLPPLLSAQWWGYVFDAGAEAWLPTPAEAAARETEYRDGVQAKRNQPSTRETNEYRDNRATAQHIKAYAETRAASLTATKPRAQAGRAT